MSNQSLGSKFNLLNIGFGNLVIAERVVALFHPASSPMRRLREDAKQQGKLIDATQGRKTRCIVVTDSGHVILSAVQPETIRQRFASEQSSKTQLDTGLSDEPPSGAVMAAMSA